MRRANWFTQHPPSPGSSRRGLPAILAIGLLAGLGIYAALIPALGGLHVDGVRIGAAALVLPWWAIALRIAALLTAAGITPSNSEANRKLKERAVKVDGTVVDDAGLVFAPGFEGVLQVGKRKFARVLLS